MGARVLLIEDEPNIREAIRFILAREGFEVAVHVDGRTAAEAVQRDPPDVVILDVMLPGRSGLDVLRDLRGSRGPAGSAGADADGARAGARSGAGRCGWAPRAS